MGLFRFGTQTCGDLRIGAEREWLVTDGLGGYAMGTVSGLRTRRYHGLLVVSGEVPGRRRLALAALDPVVTLSSSGSLIRLGVHEWASGAVEPRGHTLLESFHLRDGLPVWRWRIGPVVMERELALCHGEPCLGVIHRVIAGGPITLAVEPLCTWRDTHAERYERDGLAVEHLADGVTVEGAYRIMGPGFEPAADWLLGAFHRHERDRGLAATEDLVRVGTFSKVLQTGESLEVIAWSGDLTRPPHPASVVVDRARRRIRSLADGANSGDEAILRRAADTFVVRSGPEAAPDIVAGYPWFGTWSRDTMISYEGIFLATGRADEGRELLRAYAKTLSQGMLANTADTGQVEYNTADATLWFLHAVDRHVTTTGDTDLAAELVQELGEIVRWHLAGTRFGLRIDPVDGLLTQGAEGYALTWMDAVVDGVPVTPRVGKTVDLNALWINGLTALAGLNETVGHDPSDLRRMAAEATASFVRRFPAGHDRLFDAVDSAGGDDPSLRPNQLLAYGLPYGPLRPADPRSADPSVVAAVGRALLTPLGLRTLASDHPAYQGAHRGDPADRDRAYHQGTVWPWLFGPYADAARAVGVPTVGLLDGVLAHLGEWGVGSVSETADGDAPHAATGCPFQAWSVAEVYRTLRMLGEGA